MESRDDINTIEMVLNGDTAAFAGLVDRYKDLVFTIAQRITQNREDAEEITQDTFVKAYQKLSSFRKESRFSTWLYRIAYNEAITKVRRRKDLTVTIEEEITASIAEDETENGFLGMEAREQKWVVDRIMARLPELEQVLVTLFYLDDQPVSEISQVTGMSESNVKVRLHRIRKKIYADLKEIMEKKAYSFK